MLPVGNGRCVDLNTTSGDQDERSRSTDSMPVAHKGTNNPRHVVDSHTAACSAKLTTNSDGCVDISNP